MNITTGCPKIIGILSSFEFLYLGGVFLGVNKLAKLIVLPSAQKGTEGYRRHRRTMKAKKGNKGNEAY